MQLEGHDLTLSAMLQACQAQIVQCTSMVHHGCCGWVRKIQATAMTTVPVAVMQVQV